MKGRKWLIAMVIVALIVAGVWFWWRSPNSFIKQEAEKLKPELRVASLNITDIDEDKISATSKITLSNNLPIEVKTNRLNYAIYIDSAKIIEDSYSKPITIRSKDTTTISFPVEVMFRKMHDILKKFGNNNVDSADYSIRTSFQVDVPIAGERVFKMDFSKRLPAVKPLKVKMGTVDLAKFGFKETEIDVVVNVTNRNSFPVRMKDGKYRFSIDDDENVMQGVMEKVVYIAPGSTEAVAMHVDLKTSKVPKLGWKMLFDKKDTRFKMNFSSKLVSENGILNDSKMNVNMSGTLNELTSAVTNK